ncbi:MAG: hypothetical protein FJX76_14145 [Armatimonadetes bacterium]|nr:hypothetical protein [Armatimonadota bacterium]
MKYLLLLLLLAIGSSGLTRADGTGIVYYLDRPARANYPLAMILQGSECLRVADKYASMIAQLNAAGIGVLRIEKPGLSADTPIGECPEEYLRTNTLERRVLDVMAVVATLRRAPDGWNGVLGIAGGSEGGLVAAAAAPLIPETGAVLLISSAGGMTFGEELLLLVEAEMRAAGAPAEAIRKRLDEMRAQYIVMRDNPVPDKEWMSDGKLARNTYLWWADALPVAAVRPLLETSAPILVLHGEADRQTPVDSAQCMLDAFQARGKKNLELRRYPGMGHSPTPRAISEGMSWLIERLTQPK